MALNKFKCFELSLKIGLKNKKFKSILFMMYSVEHPYYMERSCGGWEGTAPKTKHNKRVIEHDEEVCVGTVKYAMLGMLETPPKGFEDVIKMHFNFKKNKIIKTVETK